MELFITVIISCSKHIYKPEIEFDSRYNQSLNSINRKKNICEEILNTKWNSEIGEAGKGTADLSRILVLEILEIEIGIFS